MFFIRDRSSPERFQTATIRIGCLFGSGLESLLFLARTTTSPKTRYSYASIECSHHVYLCRHAIRHSGLVQERAVSQRRMYIVLLLPGGDHL